MAITLTPKIDVLSTSKDGGVTTRKIRASATYIDSGTGVTISKYKVKQIPNDGTQDVELNKLGKAVADLIDAEITPETAEEAAIVDYTAKFQTYLDERFTV